MTSVIATRKRVAWIIAAVVVSAVFLYGLRVAWLWMMATEGDDVPPASSISLPVGANILREDTTCGSGGCALVLEVMPPSGQSPTELARTLGATPQFRLPGNLLDPRTIYVVGEPGDEVLRLRADYFSGDYVP
jgi:hypothetical protein